VKISIDVSSVNPINFQDLLDIVRKFKMADSKLEKCSINSLTPGLEAENVNFVSLYNTSLFVGQQNGITGERDRRVPAIVLPPRDDR
jgi:hypothetical protein